MGDVVTASAPGRVNLIGEHTDYNGGFVLPTVIPQRTRVTLALRGDDEVRATSRECGAGAYRLGAEARGGGWLDYVQGVTAALAADGHALAGFDLEIASEVPAGAGVSSSAALAIAVLRALRDAFGLPLDDLALARIARRAENELVGAPVGIMDPLVVSLGEPGVALLVDTRALEVSRHPLPASLELVVIASGLTHDHAAGGYRVRRAECERAAALLGVATLRELGDADLSRAAALPPPLDRRVRHVVTENARVLAAVRALDGGDADALGALFAASHASMRDDFEISTPEIDELVAIAAADRDVVAARLTGGGFGGSIVALARRGAAAGAARRVAEAYRRATGRTARTLVPTEEEP